MKFALTTCLLLATSALASNIDSSRQESVQPIDYNDDLQLRSNPAGGHIFFNYQQLRLDQPPQVDIRDEEIARYMYRARTTPTPVYPTTSIPVEEINLDFLPFNKVQAEKRFPSVDIWQQRRTTRPPPPPPTTLKWEQFSDNFQVDNQAQHNPSQWAAQFQAQAPSMVAQASPTFAPIVVLPTRRTHEESTTTVEPRMLQEEVRQPIAHAWQETRALGANRGNHKFSWDDVLLPLPPPQRKVDTLTRAPTTTAAPTAPPAPFGPRVYPGGLPPAPPTLTSWNGDNLR